MTPIRFPIRSERPQDGPQIEDLLDRAFGADRHARPSYRLRAGIPPLRPLCFVAETERRIVGAIRHWPVRIGDARPAVLLGPIAVDPAFERQGIGTRLVQTGLAAVREAGHEAVVAVGTPAYLGRFGFTAAGGYGIALPGLDEPRRLLALALVPGALDGAGGVVARVSPTDPPVRP